VTNHVTLKSENGPGACVLAGLRNKPLCLRPPRHARRLHDHRRLAHQRLRCRRLLRRRPGEKLHDQEQHGNRSGSGGNGAGVYLSWTDTGLVENCTIYSNSAFNNGGGIYANVGADFQNVRNCLFFANSADWGGGIYSAPYGASINTVTIEGCTVARTPPPAPRRRDPPHNTLGALVGMTATVVNCVIYTNVAAADPNLCVPAPWPPPSPTSAPRRPTPGLEHGGGPGLRLRNGLPAGRRLAVHQCGHDVLPGGRRS